MYFIVLLNSKQVDGRGPAAFLDAVSGFEYSAIVALGVLCGPEWIRQGHQRIHDAPFCATLGLPYSFKLQVPRHLELSLRGELSAHGIVHVHIPSLS